MIPSGVQIFLALAPIDLRWSFDRLSGVAQEAIGYEPRSGALFVFYGRRKDALKILFFDGTGMCIFYKRLDKGVIRIPTDLPPGTTRVEIDDATLEALLDGIEVEAEPSPKRRRAVH